MDRQITKAKGANTLYTNEVSGFPYSYGPYHADRGRGINVYQYTDILAATGRDENGALITVPADQLYYYLTVRQRIMIFRLSSPVFGVVTSRMNRVSSIDFNIVPKKNTEDMMSEQMKDMYAIYKEYDGRLDLKAIMVRARIVQAIRKELPEIFPDMSNFQAALLRWRKRIKNAQTIKGEEIKEWLQQPNAGTTWETYAKKLVFDLMVHGSAATYKQSQNDRLENFDLLPGGTVYKIRNRYFSGLEGYVQYIPGHEAQIFWANEMAYAQYVPTSSMSNSMIPLESLMAKITEHLLFDNLMAEQADGTKPPQKLVMVGESQNPFGDFDKEDQNTATPMDGDIQQRIEEKMNLPTKTAVITFAGRNATILDLTKENTMGIQNQRQKDIREEVAMVFNMSNMEINLTGSADTSGRSTSEAQAEIEQGKGIGPILETIQNMITYDILPCRFGACYKMQYVKAKNELEQNQIESVELQNGKITVNELRDKYDKPVFPDNKHDLPKDTAALPPDGSEQSPFAVKQIDK